MQEADLAVLAVFEEVWQRVQTGKETEEAAASVDWQTLLQGLYQRQRCLKNMARCARGETKMILQRLCRETETCLRELQTVHYLEQGDIFITKECCGFARCAPYNLQKLYQNAEKLAELMKNASVQGNSELTACASSMERQAECLRGLLCRALR